MTPRGALPAYVQIAEMLLREISAGRLVDGARFPPERAQAASLGVSVGTLRKALAELEAQGFLERRQGSGNYVRVSQSPEGIYKFFRLETPGGGGLPTAEVLEVARLVKPGDLPEFGTDREAHRIRRMRALDGVPVALEEIWLDGARAAMVTADDLSESLYEFYRNSLGFWIASVEDSVSVAPMPDWVTPQLGAPGLFVGFVERLSRAQDSALAEYSKTWFHPERARYVSRLR